MPVDSKHPAYKVHNETFIDCRAAFEGSRAIKAAGSRYLPRLKGQENDDYNAYKERAVFFGVTQKTISALVGMALMRDPILKHTPEMDYYFKDRQGAQFFELCSTTIQEVLLMGGFGLFVDAPLSGGKPEIYRYTRESVINWRTDDDGRLLMVMLQESVLKAKTDDEYDYEYVNQYRKLYLDAGGFYRVTVFDDGLKQVTDVMPTVKGQPLRQIPFFMINPLGVNTDVIRPPVMDIVDLNISMYRSSADLEHGRHFTGLPTPVVIGAEAAELRIGSQSAWVLPNPQSDAKYLEFTGQGLQSLEKAIVEKTGQMASMSARLIDNSKRGSEAEGTVRMRYMSETASLTTVVRSVEDGLVQVYSLIAQFLDTAPPEITLNKLFIDAKLSAADLNALIKAYTEGTISQDTFLYNLRRGDMLSSHRSDEEEKRFMLPPSKEESSKTNPSSGE